MNSQVLQEATRSRLVLPVLGLLIFFALALQAAAAKAPTSDEGMHLLRGAVLWQTGDLSLQGQHTPLSHWLIGLLLRLEPTVPQVTTLPAWASRSAQELMQSFLWQSGANVDRLLLLGRLAPTFVGLLMGALLSRWAGRMGGWQGRATIMALFAFSPNLLASAALATTDAIAAATFVTTLFALSTYWRQPSPARGLLVGLTLGLALAAKLTGVLLLPLVLVLSAFAAWRQGRSLNLTILAWVGQLLVAGLVLWVIYGFEIGPPGSVSLPVPAPTYVGNFTEVQAHIERGHFAFLLGERSRFGWWYYFLVAFLVKTPSVTLILLAVSVAYLARRRRWLSEESLLLWLPALAILAVASASGLNIGYRHILAAVPLTWLLIALGIRDWATRPVVSALLVVGLGAYGLLGLRQAPHFLTYFNEFVGGSANGYHYLGDSNLDWGQDLKLLADYVASESDRDLYVSYAGAADPAYYGLDGPMLLDTDSEGPPFAPSNPAPGRYLISANHLQSGPEAQPDLFDRFRSQEPIGNLGFSILIYDIKDRQEGEWVAHCQGTELGLDEATAEVIVGSDLARHVYFDCRSSWVFPAAGTPGWYVLPLETGLPPDGVLLGNGPDTVFQNRHNTQGPAYRIGYWPGDQELVATLMARSAPLSLPDGRRADPPLLVADRANLLAGWAAGNVWVMAWQTLAPSQEPLSTLLHLYGQATGIQVGDGLGFEPVQWQPGDLFLQYYDFGTASGQFLETGLYNYVTMEQLPFEATGGATAVRVDGRVSERPLEGSPTP